MKLIPTPDNLTPDTRLVACIYCAADLRIEMGKFAAMLSGLDGAYPGSYVLPTTGGWTWIGIKAERGGGAAEPGGGDERGEAPDFFPADPAPPPPGSETAAKPVRAVFDAAQPTAEPAAETERHRAFWKWEPTIPLNVPDWKGPGDDRLVITRLAFSMGWKLRGDAIAGGADCHAAFWAWLPDQFRVMDQDGTGRFELLADAWSACWATCHGITPSEPTYRQTAAQPPSYGEAFLEWKDGWGNRFRDDAETRLAFDSAWNDGRASMPTVDPDVEDQRNRYRADLQVIGRLIGCDHVEDGLARCVRETLDPALDLARAVARLNPAAGEIGEGMLTRLQTMAMAALKHREETKLISPAPPGESDPTFPCPRCGKPSTLFDHTGILCHDCEISFDSGLPDDEAEALASTDPAHQDWLARITAAGWKPTDDPDMPTHRELAQAEPVGDVPTDHPANKPPKVVKRPRHLKRLGKDIDPPAAPTGDWDIPDPPPKRGRGSKTPPPTP